MIAYVGRTVTQRILEPASPPETSTLAKLRRTLLLTLLIGIAGTGAELLLLGHIEGWRQWMPLALLGAALPVAAWHALRPARTSVRVLQGLMLLFIVNGGVGVLLHYQGNAAFELEMYPSMTGAELFGSTMTGATPVLAPGTMIVLGLVGLACVYHHPRNPRAPARVED
jgi:hypothetical protein